jgi:hypothetical protein
MHNIITSFNSLRKNICVSLRIKSLSQLIGVSQRVNEHPHLPLFMFWFHFDMLSNKLDLKFLYSS